MKKINLVRDIENQKCSLSLQKINTKRILYSTQSFHNRKQKKQNKSQCSSLYGLTSKRIFLSLKQKKSITINQLKEKNQQKRKYLQFCPISQQESSLILKLNGFKIDINIHQLKNQKPKMQKPIRRKYQPRKMIKSSLSCQNNLKVISTPKNNLSVLISQNLVKSQGSSMTQLKDIQNNPVISCPSFWKNQRQVKNRIDRIRNIKKIQFKDNFITI